MLAITILLSTDYPAFQVLPILDDSPFAGNDPLHIGVHDDLPELASILRKAQESLTAEEWTTLRQRWLYDGQGNSKYAGLWRWGLAVLVVLALVSLVLILRNRRLEKDVAQRRAAAREEREQRARLQAVMEANPEAVWSFDHQFCAIAFNSVFAEMYQNFFQSPIQIGQSYLADADPASQQLWRGRYQRVLSGETFTLEEMVPVMMVDEQDPEAAPIATDRNVLFDFHPIIAGDEVTGGVCMMRDITEQRQYESSLLAAKKDAESANEAKSMFLANMSHEIRTPMNGILSLTNLIAEGQLDPQQQKYMGLVQECGHALLTLINDILDLSKIEASSVELERVSLNLASLLDGVVTMVSTQAGEKQIELRVDLADDVPRFISGDPTRLRQCVLNLVSNAVKFTEVGSVTIRVRAQDVPDDEQRKLLFEVQDTGIGIPEDRLRDVFSSFEQADISTTRRFGGTGLGLAITSRLTELMQGKIGIESTVGVGSTFLDQYPVDTRLRIESTITPIW